VLKIGEKIPKVKLKCGFCNYLAKKDIKKMKTCPFCGRAGLSERKVKKPKYRCPKCMVEFAKPIYQIPSHHFLSSSMLKQKIKKKRKRFNLKNTNDLIN